MTSFTSHWGSGATMWVSICPLLNPVSNDSVNEQHRFRITDRAAGFSLLITSSEGQLMRRRLNKEKSWDTERWMNISSARLCHISSDRLQCEPITFFCAFAREEQRAFICAPVDPAPHQPNERRGGGRLSSPPRTSFPSPPHFSSRPASLSELSTTAPKHCHSALTNCRRDF